ncbi:MAG: 8-hydroxy-5-deazaflavin:NADPH oxidoreductase [Azoarcus sp.]|nr:prephenate dehydrogenase [Azoarcus sp. Aa7]MCK9987166.1 8-hydroxy-5-deazaflavin:NADPH oxidoreductase [Azoarcus sp.]
MTDKLPTIAIIGGTGDLGTGLARRWAQAGYNVIIGSRTVDRAAEAVTALRAVMAERGCKSVSVQAADNVSAAREADIVALTVPFAHHRATLESIRDGLAGKILIDVTVPLVPPKVARVQLPPEGSAGQIAQNLLGESVRVVSAFQNVAAEHLKDGHSFDCDVLVCGDSKEAREAVIALVEAAGLRGFHAGSIANAAAVEALTSALIFINKQYQCHAGIRLTGVAAPGA